MATHARTRGSRTSALYSWRWGTRVSEFEMLERLIKTIYRNFALQRDVEGHETILYTCHLLLLGCGGGLAATKESTARVYRSKTIWPMFLKRERNPFVEGFEQQLAIMSPLSCYLDWAQYVPLPCRSLGLILLTLALVPSQHVKAQSPQLPHSSRLIFGRFDGQCFECACSHSDRHPMRFVPSSR